MKLLRKIVEKRKQDEPINRRTYERQLTQLKMPSHYVGFTNRILSQEKGDVLNLFIPVYVILKIKSLQEVDVSKLVGSVSVVILVNVLVENLPEPIVHLLSNNIELQINRSQSLILKKNKDQDIQMSRSKKMLKFIIRRSLTASIVEDTFWSPFQIISLISSITVNSITKKGAEIRDDYEESLEDKGKQGQILEKILQNFGASIGNLAGGEKKGAGELKKMSKKRTTNVLFDDTKKYSISFNCMRNGLKTPISYALGCVYALYDLAETKLQVYHTHLDSYNEVIKDYKDRKDKKKQQGHKGNRPRQPFKRDKAKQLDEQNRRSKVISPSKLDLMEIGEEIFKEVKKDEQDGNPNKQKIKPNYSQYTHFVIPLYKYPSNSLFTIFIPILLLALLSLALFFQDNDLSSRIGHIATMVLGYIQLIPAVKGELPPSSKITVIEIVIYISTLCCLFSLVESFLIDDIDNYEFIWYQNTLFLFCLFTHLSIFMFVLGLVICHKFIWQPSYNLEQQAPKTDPEINPESWINFYCDEQFYKVNEKIYRKRKLMESTRQPKSQIHSELQIEDKKSEQLCMIRKYNPNIKIEKSPVPSISGSLKTDRVPQVSNDLKVETGITRERNKSQHKGNVTFKEEEKKHSEMKSPSQKKSRLRYQMRLEELDQQIEEGRHISLPEKKIDHCIRSRIFTSKRKHL